MQLLIALLTANYIHCSNQKYFEKKNENYDAKMKFLTQLLIALSAADSIFLISALFTLITRQSFCHQHHHHSHSHHSHRHKQFSSH